MRDSTGALTYAVRLPVVAHYLGQLGLMVALLSVPPLAVSLLTAEYAYSLRYALVIGLLLLPTPAVMRRPEPTHIQANEAIVVVSCVFVLAPLLMSFPLAASGLPFEDVLFEAVSAITTTGLSTAGSIAGASPTFLFSRAWMQWFGGLGIAVLSVALLMGHHIAARRLSEPTDTENLATTARAQARQVLAVYGVLTLAGSLALWLATGSPFDALVHMLSTVSTGGFATRDGSLAAMSGAGPWIVTVFSLLGAIPLLLYFGAARGRYTRLATDPEVRALVVLVVLVTGLLALSLHYQSGLDWPAALHHGALLGSAAQTTSGFSSLTVGELDAASELILIVAMLVGGSTGSTAGGIKLLRLLILLRLLQHFIQRTAMPPHAVSQPRLAGRLVEQPEVYRLVLLLGLFAASALFSWAVFVAFGYEPLDALLETVSALGTVGLSTGISSPDLETPLKLLLCVNMLLGRLEFLALLVLIYPKTWIGKRAS
jgi:trk system potassium uptake protein TrkH